MLLTATAICVVVLGLLIFAWIKRKRRDRKIELEKHSLTAEELHSLLASQPELLVFDVRQPLDLLAYPEVIPGARRVPPKEVLEKPSLIPKEKDAVIYCTCPGEKTSREDFGSGSRPAFFPDQIPERWIGGLEGEWLSSRAIPGCISPLRSRLNCELRVKR